MNFLQSIKGAKKVVCLHHNDVDGHCSAAIVDRYFENKVNFYSMDYSREIPFGDMGHECVVVIVDYSPGSVEDFNKILQITPNIIWIDHHKTALEKFKELSHLMGLRRDGTAACELAWEYFFQTPAPYAVALMGDYDVWKFAYGVTTTHFQAGLRLEDTRPFNNKFWDRMLSEDTVLMADILTNGRVITKYNDHSWERSLRAVGYRTTLGGLRCVACNIQGSSDVFKSLKAESVDVFIVYGHNGKNFKCTLYSKGGEVDVSEIATKYGGGGHAGASGFFCDTLPFKFERRLEKEDFNKERL